MLEAAFVAGMAAEGVVVHRLGVVPTPAVAFEANRRDAVGAVISGSHNPYHDNGIKLFARGGTKLPDEVEERIEHEVLALPPPSGEPAQLLDAEESPDYLAHLVDALDGRTLSGLRIVVDCANGAASAVAPRVFTMAGADVVAIHNHAERTQHQRSLRGDPSRLARPPRSLSRVPTSGSPSTATPIGCSPSITPVASSTAITSWRSAPPTSIAAAPFVIRRSSPR